MFKIFLFLVVLGTTLADDDFDDRFDDDSREIHFVRGSPTLKAAGVPLPFNFFKGAPLTKAVEPVVKTASDVEVVHVDQQVEPNAQTPNEITEPKVETPAVNFRAPFFVKVDDDDDDDDDRVYFRKAGAPSAVPLTYSSGPYGFKFDFDDDDDDDHKGFFRNANPNFRNAFLRIDDDDDARRFFFRSPIGVPLPAYGDKKVLTKSAVNTAPKFVLAGYKIDDDDDNRFYFRTAGNPSPIPYSARYRFDDDDDLYDFDDK